MSPWRLSEEEKNISSNFKKRFQTLHGGNDDDVVVTSGIDNDGEF